MADSINRDMDFCKCKHFVPKDDNEYICECEHDIHDHVHQEIGGCESRLD